MAKRVNPTSMGVYNMLQELGVKPGTAAGAIGSLIGESGERLNTGAINPRDGRDGSDSIGMGQWNQGRAVALRRTAQEMGVPWTDPRAQIQHMKNELTGSHGHVLKSLLAAGDNVAAGNNIWTRQYEVPANAGAVARARLGDGVAFARDVGAMSPDQIAAITSTAQAARTAPAAPAASASPARSPFSAGSASSVRDMATSGNFGMPGGMLPAMSMGGPMEAKTEEPPAQLATADRGQADALTLRALGGGARSFAPIENAAPQARQQVQAPVQVAAAGNAWDNDPVIEIGAPPSQVRGNAWDNDPVVEIAAPKPDPYSEAPAAVRFEVGALNKPEDRLAAIRKHYPDAQPSGDDNFTYTDPATGKPSQYRQEGWRIPTKGDFASIASDGAEMIGSGLGAVGGGIAGAFAGPAAPVAVPAGAMAGAGVGGTAAREAAQRGINWWHGNEDTRTGNEQLTDAAITFGANGVGQGAGMALGAAAKGIKAGAGGVLGKVLGRGSNPEGAELATTMTDLGLQPTAGMVSQGMGGVMEQTLATNPVAGRSIRAAQEAARDGLAGRFEATVNGIGSTYNPPSAKVGSQQELGGRLQDAARESRQLAEQMEDGFYQRVAAHVGDGPAQGGNTAALANALAQERQGLGQFNTLNRGSQLDDAMRQTGAINADLTGGANFDALKNARTQVGRLQFGTDDAVQQEYLGRLYGALGDDMKATVSTAGPEARYAFDLANDFARGLRDKASPESLVNTVNPLLKAGVTPEQAYDMVLRGTDKGATRLAALRRTVRDSGTWSALTASLVERMGKSVDSVGNLSEFNGNQFMKQWRNLPTETKDVLFKGTELTGYRSDLDRIARVANGLAQYDKGRNHSNSATHLALKSLFSPLGVGGAVGVGNSAYNFATTGNLSPGTGGLAAAGALAGGSFAARSYASYLMTKPSFVNWLAKAPQAQVRKGGLAVAKEQLRDLAAREGFSEYADAYLKDTEN